MANLRESENVLQCCKYHFEGDENGQQKDTLFTSHPVYQNRITYFVNTSKKILSVQPLVNLILTLRSIYILFSPK